jgi:hypothetical protein
MQDFSPVVADGQKTLQNTKRAHRRNGLAMVSEERQPSLQRIWISQGSPDPSRDAPFRQIETSLSSSP